VQSSSDFRRWWITLIELLPNPALHTDARKRASRHVRAQVSATR
jgi:hypothetical protein